MTALAAPTPEQEELRASARKFLAERASLDDTVRLAGSAAGYDEAVWRIMGEQLGWPALLVPDEYDGAGASFAELSVLLEEMGAVLYSGPFLASAVLTTTALLCCGDESAKRDYLPRLAAGDLIGTLAVYEDNGRHDPSQVRCRAARSGSGWRLDGTKTLVLDASVAGLLLVAARGDEDPGLFAVDTPAAVAAGTAEVVTLRVMDDTRRLSTVTLRGCPAVSVGPSGAGLAVTLDLAAVALAAEQVGGAQQALDDAVAYAKTRWQFGRPVGSFQAVKHRCADMYMAVQGARAVTAHAIATAAASTPGQQPDRDLGHASSLAKAYCSDAFFAVASENIQVHGGIGFTWEHSAHRYFRRAQSGRVLFGDPSWHRRRVLAAAGLSEQR
jgi:alkylation response protein AidB-like acyl-CoA dehydrogenase